MLTRLFNGPQMTAMEKALDGSALRQKIIANNIANVDTPKYKALAVTFEDQLQEAFSKQAPGSSLQLTTTNPRHIPIQSSVQSVDEVSPKVEEIKDWTLRNDKNNVDNDREMAQLAKNEIYYDAVMRNMNDEFRLLRAAITEGRK